MYRYCHGGNAAFENESSIVLDLSANINPLGMPDGVSDAIVNGIGKSIAYPDNASSNLCFALAQYEKASPEMIFCGNGASDIIFRLPRAAMASSVMVLAPTFSDYERSAVSNGAGIIRYPLAESASFMPDFGFFDCVRRESPDLVYFCNPNNPTGYLADTEFIGELLECCKSSGALVAIDECFLDFSEHARTNTSKCFLERYANLIIIKAFTKLFALPGIRLGYALCSDIRIVDRLRYHGADWPVSNLAQAAGIAALDCAEEYIKRSVSFITKERAVMEERLDQFGYKVFNSEANYVFIKNPFKFALGKELDKRGIRIRECGNYHGLDDRYFRIGLSTSGNNAKLLDIIGSLQQNKEELPA